MYIRISSVQISDPTITRGILNYSSRPAGENAVSCSFFFQPSSESGFPYFFIRLGPTFTSAFFFLNFFNTMEVFIRWNCVGLYAVNRNYETNFGSRPSQKDKKSTKHRIKWWKRILLCNNYYLWWPWLQENEKKNYLFIQFVEIAGAIQGDAIWSDHK